MLESPKNAPREISSAVAQVSSVRPNLAHCVRNGQDSTSAQYSADVRSLRLYFKYNSNRSMATEAPTTIAVFLPFSWDYVRPKWHWQLSIKMQRSPSDTEPPTLCKDAIASLHTFLHWSLFFWCRSASPKSVICIDDFLFKTAWTSVSPKHLNPHQIHVHFPHAPPRYVTQKIINTNFRSVRYGPFPKSGVFVCHHTSQSERIDVCTRYPLRRRLMRRRSATMDWDCRMWSIVMWYTTDANDLSSIFHKHYIFHQFLEIYDWFIFIELF